MILGEIIIEDKLKDNSLIKQLKSKEILNIKEENDFNGIPTLYVGWRSISKLFTTQSIFNKKVKKNIYWTFSPEENLQDFNEDILNFVDKLYGDVIKEIEYIFLDPIIFKFKEIQDFLDLSISNRFNIMYQTDEFIYLYSNDKNRIFGIDLNYYKVLKINNKKLIKELTENSDKVYVEDYTLDTGVYQKYKNLLNKDVDKKYLVYFLFKNTSQV